MILAVVNSRSFDAAKLSSLRCSVLAGAAIAGAQVHRLMKVLPNNHFIISYGLSELAPVSMTSFRDTETHIAGTVGKPVKGIEIRIHDIESDTDCTPGDGRSVEILVRGYSMMACYYKRDIDDQSVDDEDWLHTGDL